MVFNIKFEVKQPNGILFYLQLGMNQEVSHHLPKLNIKVKLVCVLLVSGRYLHDKGFQSMLPGAGAVNKLEL